MSGNLGLLFLICWPIIGGIATYVMGKKNAEGANDMADIVAFVQCVVFGAICYLTATQGLVEFKITDFMGLSLTLRVDLFRSIVGLMVTLCFVIAGFYTKKQAVNMKNLGRYQMFMLFTMGMAGGMFLSAGITAAFLFLELMMLSVFPLIAHDETEASIKAASQYLVANVAGGLVSVMGLVRLVSCVGSLSLDTFYGGMLGDSVTMDVIIACGLVVVGYMIQAGGLIFGFWTKKAMAVTPDSAWMCIMTVCTRAALMGAIMLTCNLMLKENEWGAVMLVLGLATLILGGIFALVTKNLKSAVTWISIGVTAWITVALGIMGLGGAENGITASGTVIVFVAGLFGTVALYMIYGAIVAHVSDADLSTVRGFGRKKPFMMVAYILAVGNLVGVPFMGSSKGYALILEGFGKYIQYENNSVISYVAKYSMILGLAILAVVVVKLFVVLFVQKNAENQEIYDGIKGNAMNASVLIALCVLVLLPVVCGVLPEMTYDKLIELGETTFRIMYN